MLVGESYLTFHGRGAMTGPGRTIAAMVNLSRQHGQTLIFIVQESRQLDVNVVSQADVIMVKELSEISRDFERRELRPFTEQARTAFAGVRGSKKRWTWVYSEPADFRGMVENELPSFWSRSLSNAFASAAGAGGSGQLKSAMPRKGRRTPKADRGARARQLHEAGQSFGSIAKDRGVSKTTAYRLVTEVKRAPGAQETDESRRRVKSVDSRAVPSVVLMVSKGLSVNGSIRLL